VIVQPRAGFGKGGGGWWLGMGDIQNSACERELLLLLGGVIAV